MSKYVFNFKVELQQTVRSILDTCYAYPTYNRFTFYLHYDDAKLIHGSFSDVRDSKSFMLNCKVWQIIEDWEKNEVWLETH